MYIPKIVTTFFYEMYVERIKIIAFKYTTELFYYGFHHKLQFSFYLELESQKEDGKRDGVRTSFNYVLFVFTGLQIGQPIWA